MQVTWLPDAQRRPRHIAVGEFDGVHLGHREVIRGADTVLTFEPHPRTVVAPDSAPKLLMSLETKADLIAGLGVQELVVIPFDGSFAAQSAQEFIDRELVERLGAERVSVGENFRFGHRARGDARLLAAQTAFETRIARLVELDGEIISSTHIRGLVASGDVAAAARFLGAPFPDHGVYACRAYLDGTEHVAAVNVGVRPTFKTGRGLLVEAFLVDFEGDLYDEPLRLDFLERLRGERRFESVDALVEQMAQDVTETRRIAA
jgi:riboflavin kinase/FMN adenylyltransferase